MYSFYEKEMGSKYCLMEASAMSWNAKRATLAQETIRRMLNTSEMVEQSERDSIIEKFILKLERSGYNVSQRKEIITAGLKGYETKRKRAERDSKELHREGKSTIVNRVRKKLTAGTSWYKQKKEKENEVQPKIRIKGKRGDNKTSSETETSQPTAVFFVPRTPNGELADMLREKEKELSKITKQRIKIVEEAGEMLKSQVHRANPWSGSDCYRDGCLVCAHKDEKDSSDCKRRNVT